MDQELKKCEQKIETLNLTVWENKVLKPKIQQWLDYFHTDTEKNYAFYLLSKMMYFSESNIKNLLKVLYREYVRYPIIQQIRLANGNTLDDALIEREFEKYLKHTIFFGIGDASESGQFFLYYFRQENDLPKSNFANVGDVLLKDTSGNVTLNPAYCNIEHFIFIDDVCGSGAQTTSDDSSMFMNVTNLRKAFPKASVSYYMLFGLAKGLDRVKDARLADGTKLYDCAESVIELDDSYSCFGPNSRYFKKVPFDKDEAKKIAMGYGYRLMWDLGIKKGLTPISNPSLPGYAASHACGFGDCQLLLSMNYNTPDNTLPIMWYNEEPKIWMPIFKRYDKKY